MRDGRSSKTAAFVLLLRALGDRGLTSAEGFRDPTARALLPSPWARALALLAPTLRALPARTRERIIARIDLLVVRSLAIDAVVTAALAGGAEQLVILGAGFDGRAHRMAALERAHVFEVDHPATQSLKRRGAEDLARTCRDLTYVACDFERDALANCLQAAGHRANEPTVWIWEGVTLYLKDEAIHATLATIAARSARASTLVLEYHDAEAPTVDPYYAFARKILLALWSEPQIGARSKDVMRAELEAAGLRLESEFGVSEWGTRFAHAAPSAMKRARIAVAASRRGAAIVGFPLVPSKRNAEKTRTPH